MRTLITAAILVVLPFSALAKDDPKEEAVEARQGYFTLLGANMGPLAAMAKGEIEYDEGKASLHSANIEALTKYDPSIHFIEGTSLDDVDDTEARPKIWSNFEDFKSKYTDLQKAGSGAAEAVKGGRGNLGPAVKKLGSACKSCHDEYREK
jgi:cytochrome c556